jgi:hypothetical protein
MQVIASGRRDSAGRMSSEMREANSVTHLTAAVMGSLQPGVLQIGTKYLFL